MNFRGGLVNENSIQKIIWTDGIMSPYTDMHELLRIILTDHDKKGSTPLLELILSSLEGHGVRGATVLHGIAGFGKSGRRHSSHILAISDTLPVVIEVIEETRLIESVLAAVSELLASSGGGVITREKVTAHFIDGTK